MIESVKNQIYRSIIEHKWLAITYVNSKNETTKFFCSVIDIDVNKEILTVDIVNVFLEDAKGDCKENINLKIKSIVTASVLENSFAIIPVQLLNKVTRDIRTINYLEIINYDNNILRYLSDAFRNDEDPYLREQILVDGIDQHVFDKKGRYKLNDEQFNLIVEDLFKKPEFEAELINRYVDLALNKFSIDIKGKQYVVAYRKLKLNFKDKSLNIEEKSTINKAFLVEEERKATLHYYLDMDLDYFASTYDEHEKEYIELIKDNFHHGEVVNTRPSLFMLQRQMFKGVDEALESINEMDRTNSLTIPLKAFFGRNRHRSGTNKGVNIVVFDKNKINIDQMRVVYNSMVNHVTYVKGPPGTGKTETIFNVLLSSYANDKTVLVCSNNNHPVNDIFHKMEDFISFKNANGEEVEFYFPIIRLGNQNETKEAIERIREIIDFAKKRCKTGLKSEITDKTKNKSMANFASLKDVIISYEDRLELCENLNTLEKIYDYAQIDKIRRRIEEQINKKKEILDKSKFIKDEDVMQYSISAKEDRDFQNFLYYSSLIKYKKLLGDSFIELREIVRINDVEDAVKALTKYLRDDDNLKRFLSVFPIVLTTNLSADKLGSPKPHFDLCIMDEAGQCNMAISLVPIVRATDLLLVGDTNQLQPVTIIEESINEKLMRKYNINPEYNYIENSIMSTMLRKDNNSKNILLRYHYRCGSKIASFVNKRYYENQLKLLNKAEGSLIYLDTKNVIKSIDRNTSYEEARKIVDIIKENKYKDVGIVTPFVNQAAMINTLLAREGIKDCKAGTIHTLQGSEKSTIIMSAAITPQTAKKTMEWIENNHELINVAVTRAKERFIFAGDKEMIDKLSGDKNTDLKVLSDYIYSNGQVEVIQSDKVILTDFSNNSHNEREFFITIKPYFNKSGTKFRILRNVPVKDALSLSQAELALAGKKEFDIVIQVGEGFLKRRYRTIVVFEVDGGEHVGSKVAAARDRKKEELCKSKGVKLIRIGNSQVKDYETIIAIFESTVQGIDFDESYKQTNLFENDENQQK